MPIDSDSQGAESAWQGQCEPAAVLRMQWVSRLQVLFKAPAFVIASYPH